MRKIFVYASVFVLIFSLFTFNAFANDTLVDDAAALFSSDEISLIDDAVSNFSDETDYSLAVVTTEDALGMTSEEYADKYYNDLIFNSGWSHDGLLMLIDMDNREVYISTTGECIAVYGDSSIDYIIDCGYDELVDGCYADCMLDMIDAAKAEALSWSGDEYYILDEEDYSYGDSEFSGGIVEFDGDIYEIGSDGEWIPVDEYDYYYNDYNNGNSNKFKISNLLTYIVVSLVIAAIAVFAVKRSYKNTGKDDGFDADDIMLNLTGSNDTVISRNVITTPLPRNNNRNNHRGGMGGGSFGGGSSVHRSGGGISHGGGGRKF